MKLTRASVMAIKTSSCIGIGVILNYLFGPWDGTFRVLVVLMALDFILGIIIGATGKSPKSETKGLSSTVCWSGLMHKLGYLVTIIVAVQLETMLKTPGLRDGIIYSLSISEIISILENNITLGVPIPLSLKKLIYRLKEEDDEK